MSLMLALLPGREDQKYLFYLSCLSGTLGDLSIDCALPLLHQSDPSTDKTILVKREEEELEPDENEELEATEDEDDCG